MKEPVKVEAILRDMVRDGLVRVVVDKNGVARHYITKKGRRVLSDWKG